MQFRLLILGTLAAALVPFSASAREEVSLTFSIGNINASWVGKGSITMEQRPDGFVLTTGNGTGMLLTSDQLTFLPDTLELHATSHNYTDIRFVWFYLEENADELAYVDVTVGPKRNVSSLLISRSSAWHRGEKTFGIMMPPNTTILLHQMRFTRWNLVESLMSGIQSWFRVETLRPYAINFAWGPAIGWNPAELAELYDNTPPIATPAVWIINWIIVLALLSLMLSRLSSMQFLQRIVTVPRLLGLIAALWILVDLHQGSQFISWVLHDHATYISQTDTDRVFRDRGNFYDFAEKAAELVQDRETYIFMSEVPWPFLGNIRYITYPSVPAFRVGIDDTWVIYDRAEISVSPNNELMFGTDIITEPGKVLYQAGEHTLVFRGTPLTVLSQ